MNRILFEANEIKSDGTATIGGVRAEHILNILHGEIGQILKTGVVDGAIGSAQIIDIKPLPPNPETGLIQGCITLRCSHNDQALPPWVDVIMAPPRPRAMKRLLPQLTQLGMGRLILVGAQKVEKSFWGAQLLKPEVYRPLLLDGLMQAGTTAMPVIEVQKSFRHYLESERFAMAFANQHIRFVAHPQAVVSNHPIIKPTERIVVAIGPEGGWLDSEMELLENRGFQRYALGPRILRTDTAAVALLARLMPTT